ncbi:pyridoxal-phosphate dependent enzyme [Couchioplanes caeruleus]|uniref:Pyridoxal-5'-phosphate-dependent protein subunit beta n=2 Tax=Couchioplanes caeruleus TaxID=56438 RepID=A0A1K0H2S4_9ACTN|nr:pyridoxal-phosphate dependent enzyme [Couchioplanes caeruleus]OJF16003.1 pyridoxal-5'-phosphate-dependent protein subunit beta [Couchioplanes caeruleus subsp. caeruleus]ROP27861.1 threonine synthase [Couchioplanes caeruleus]
MFLVDRSGRRYPLDEPRWRGDDGSPLMVAPLPGITRADVDTSVRSAWRYAAALPVPIAHPVTLGEGWTPMLPLDLDGVVLRVKPEWLNPTGSFKDRGTTVMVSALRRQGVTEMLEDSSGNGGSSVAAYAAAAGIRATVLAPEATSAAKIQQSRVHGATVELVPGSRQDTADAAVRRSASVFYASHNWHPFFLQGTKLLAYEIWEDLGFAAPDAVVLPCGAGSLVLGLHLGFGELLSSGAITRRPRLLVAQPGHCAPLVAAFAGGAGETAPGEWAPTVAEGTAIARPVRDREVLEAIRVSGGDMAAVAEHDIGPATFELAGRGLYAEPTSAIVVPAVREFLRRGSLRRDEATVMILTGSACKAADAVGRLLAARNPS